LAGVEIWGRQQRVAALWFALPFRRCMGDRALAALGPGSLAFPIAGLLAVTWTAWASMKLAWVLTRFRLHRCAGETKPI
jgi:hypothetical protein